MTSRKLDAEYNCMRRRMSRARGKVGNPSFEGILSKIYFGHFILLLFLFGKFRYFYFCPYRRLLYFFKKGQCIPNVQKTCNKRITSSSFVYTYG